MPHRTTFRRWLKTQWISLAIWLAALGLLGMQLAVFEPEAYRSPRNPQTLVRQGWWKNSYSRRIDSEPAVGVFFMAFNVFTALPLCIIGVALHRNHPSLAHVKAGTWSRRFTVALFFMFAAIFLYFTYVGLNPVMSLAMVLLVALLVVLYLLAMLSSWTLADAARQKEDRETNLEDKHRPIIEGVA